MPEIAEVETVRNTLKRMILKEKIVDVKVYYEKMIDNDIDYFCHNLKGEHINDILRRGKWLIFELDNYYLLSHLRMEGKYFVKDKDEVKDKHEHVIFTFSDNKTLRYHDTRKFGRMKLVPKDKITEVEELNKQGIEPLDKRLNQEYLYNKIHTKNTAIKTVLLDQTIISGLGNIYADEVLFEARINPLRKANSIKKAEAGKIVMACNKIIMEAIKCGGTTIRSYTSSLGVTVRFQQYLMVHKRENEKCYKCGSLIKREKVNGRSTYYCPKCQK